MTLERTALFCSCYFDFLIPSVCLVFIYIYAPLSFSHHLSSYVSCFVHWQNSIFEGSCSCCFTHSFVLNLPFYIFPCSCDTSCWMWRFHVTRKNLHISAKLCGIRSHKTVLTLSTLRTSDLVNLVKVFRELIVRKYEIK